MVTDNPGWEKRFYHSAAVFQDKLWILGGTYMKDYNDIWSSDDGKTWKQITDSASWSQRQMHSTVVFNNKLWVLGGTGESTNALGDVWFSADGKTWECATADAGWKRYGHTSVVFDNKMWVIGGCDGIYNKNDSWYSTDGKTWKQVQDSASWSKRFLQATAIFNDKIWVIGGMDDTGKIYDDFWFSTPSATSTCNPSLVQKTKDLSITQVIHDPTTHHTTITFTAEPANPLTLSLYTVQGKKLGTQLLQPSFHTFLWKGTDFSSQPVAPGIYFLQFSTQRAKQSVQLIKNH